MNFVSGAPVVAFVTRNLGVHRDAYGNGVLAIGQEDGGAIIAGIVYGPFNGHNVHAHIASDGSRRWMTRAFLREMFRVPFLVMGAKRITVQRTSAVDGSVLPDAKFKDMDQFLASLQALADPGAASNYVARQFQHDIETRKVKAEEKKADASVVASGAAAAQAGVATKREQRAMDREDALQKASADYQAALDSGIPTQIAKAKVAFLAAGGKLEKPTLEYTGNTDAVGNTNVIEKSTGAGMKLNGQGQVVARWDGIKDQAAAAPKNQSDAETQARAAIAAGADKAAVNARLKQLGFKELP